MDYTGQLAASQKNKDDEDGQGMKKSGSTSSLAGALAAMAAEQGLGLETRASSEAIDEDEGKAAEDSEEDPDTHPTTTSKKKDALIGGQHSSLIGGQHPSGVEIEGVVPIVRSRSTSTSNPHPPPPPSKEVLALALAKGKEGIPPGGGKPPATTAAPGKGSGIEGEDTKLIADEERAAGTVGMGVYIFYFQHGSYYLIVLTVLFVLGRW